MDILKRYLNLDKQQSNHQHHHYRDAKREHNRGHNYHQGHSNQGHNNHAINHSPQRKTAIKIAKLHYGVTKEQLQSICQKFGPVKICKIDWDKMGRSNETATAEYFQAKDAQNAENGLNQMQIEGQKIEAVLSYPERMPAKRHIIHKNYSSRYNKNNTNKFRR